MNPTDAEEAKLVILARGARSRVAAHQGAALRDETGRTYSAASVELPSLQLSAVQLAVAVASSSGAQGLEAVVLCAGDEQFVDTDLAVIRDLAGSGVPVLIVDPGGDEKGRAVT